ncbi:MAG: hypothetical protein IJ737_01410 [Ruminococcus sp.]|nr:hypothetical protein [Ruminococcus sp.]MBR2282959.1 hypothetical protein [Ruminococcus sp.]
MKVDKIDYAWAVISWVVIGVTFRKGVLHFGILIVYGLMAVLFFWHIYTVRRRIRGSEAAIGTITGYHTSENGRLWYPIVRYETEEGREVTSVYSHASKKADYETGSEEMILYTPSDPMFFYFASRESELTAGYYKYLIYSGIAAIALFLLTMKVFN